MRRLKLLLEYDGTPFQGFQRHGPKKPHTVQDELENKLSQLLARPIKTWCAGRTDAGVHATGQVVAFDTDSDRSLNDLVRGANALLRDEVRVLSAEEVGPDFHPRFSAQTRIYHYFVVPGGANAPPPGTPHSALHQGRDPFFAKRVWHHREPLDAERMHAAAQRLLGSHDFSAYCRGVKPDEPRRRHLLRLDVVPCEPPTTGPFQRLRGMLRVEVEANAFLRRMVRMLVGNLAAVGRGEWDEEQPYRVLLSQNPDLSAPSAPPHGLYLVEVTYAAPAPPGTA